MVSLDWRGSCRVGLSVLAALAVSLPYPRHVHAQEHYTGILLGQWRPPEGQRCEEAREAFGSFSVVFDSSAVARDLVHLVDSGAVVLSAAMYLASNRPGRNDTIWTVESTLSDSTVATIVAALRRNVRERVDQMGLVRIDLAHQFSARTARSLQCLPVLAEPTRFVESLQEMGRQGLHGSTTVQLVVNRDGSVGNVVLQGSTGSRNLDNAIYNLVLRQRYTPAIVNGRVIPLGLRLPIAVN